MWTLELDLLNRGDGIGMTIKFEVLSVPYTVQCHANFHSPAGCGAILVDFWCFHVVMHSYGMDVPDVMRVRRTVWLSEVRVVAQCLPQLYV